MHPQREQPFPGAVTGAPAETYAGVVLPPFSPVLPGVFAAPRSSLAPTAKSLKTLSAGTSPDHRKHIIKTKGRNVKGKMQKEKP